ncbi:hypothetical protein ABW20_dc0100277 [Dactylellina cionopaga]|nr:hypothetical protein ABW20_dc0100277 [Dactylellina cionopaga]
MLHQSWSIRIEAPKRPQPSPRSAASIVAHWAGIPHYRLPRFNLSDEAMLQELQVEEFEGDDDEDYSLLPSRSSTVKKPRHEIDLVNVPDRKGFTDRAPKPAGGKLRKARSSKGKSSHVNNVPAKNPTSENKELELHVDDSRVIPGQVYGNKSVPADFDSTSTDYPRHPRTPDRYMLPLSRGSSQRERRNSLTSRSSDRTVDHSFNDMVKAPIALRKSPPQFLQNWDDNNPYNYINPSYDIEVPYPPRARPTNRTMSIPGSSRLPILHESKHEISMDEGYYGMSRAQTMPSEVQHGLAEMQTQYRRSRRESDIATGQKLHSGSQVSPQVHAASNSTIDDSHITASHSPDEPALTEMSTEILIAGERTKKRPHPQPIHSIEAWMQRVGTPARAMGTPKTIPSTIVEVEGEDESKDKKIEDVGNIWQVPVLHKEIENPDIPIPVPTKTPTKEPKLLQPVAETHMTLISPSPEPVESDITQTEAIALRKQPTVEGIRNVELTAKQDILQTPTPVTVVRITPPAEASSPLSLLPPTPPPRLPPPPPPRPEPKKQHSPFSIPASTFKIDPRAAEKRRMTVAFGINPLQRRETAELAQDVMRRVSSVSGGRRGSLASVIRVVDAMLVKEREEQLRQMRRIEMAWD